MSEEEADGPRARKDSLGDEIEDDVFKPTSMKYSEEGVYETRPDQAIDETPEPVEGIYGNLEQPMSMKYSEEGIYDNPLAVRMEDLNVTETPVRASANRQEVIEKQTKERTKKKKKTTKIKDPEPMEATSRPDYEEPEGLVHESDLRKAARGEGTVVDQDIGQPCTKCADCTGWEEHVFRKICTNCHCPRYIHQSSEMKKRRQNSESQEPDLLDLQKILAKDSEAVDLQEKYAWVPMELTAAQCKEYFAELPPGCVPVIGTEGEKWRHIQLQLQMPRHDTNYKYCDKLTSTELEWFKAFDEVRMKEAFDIGEVVPCPDFRRPPDCKECSLKSDGSHWPYCSYFVEPDRDDLNDPLVKPVFKAAGIVTEEDLMPSTRSIKEMKKKKKGAKIPEAEPNRVPQEEIINKRKGKPSGGRCHGCMSVLKIGELVVQCERFRDGNHYFHPRCFMCSQCGELLVDLRVYVDIGAEERGHGGAEQRLFCGRHWSDNSKPRCTACDETIHEQKHVFEIGSAWHYRHFCCYICDKNLTRQKTYVPRDGKPLCFLCYSEHIADKCTSCGGTINPSGGKVSVKNKHWHAACFCCKKCGTSLDGKPCVPKGDKLYCKKCYKRAKRAKESG